MDNILQTLLEEFRDALSKTEKSIPRNFQFPAARNIIKVAIGMRRSGKTYFLFQTIRHLVSSGVSLERILYINFEDERLLPLDPSKMGRLIDAFYTLYPENHNCGCYFFFDEVQNVDEWATVIRRFHDTKNAQIYLTGSSAKLLSKEIATSLRGRSLAIEIYPYDYLEFLQANHFKAPSKPFGKKSLDTHRGHLLQFFRVGGFPGIQIMSTHEQLEMLQNYVETVIFRDIVERYQIENVALLRYFTGILLKSVSSLVSINKIYKDIKSQGYKVGKDTLYNYLEYLEDAFLLFSCPIFTESLRQMQTTPKKIYAIDNGLVSANTFNFSDNMGKYLENQVYLDLRRQGKDIFYYRTQDGYEVDFITRDIRGQHEIIQVVWDKSDSSTLEREERALKQAEKELGLPGKLIDWSIYLSSKI